MSLVHMNFQSLYLGNNTDINRHPAGQALEGQPDGILPQREEI